MTKQCFTIPRIPVRPSRLVVMMVAIASWSALGRSEEASFAPNQNAYNPIPSPDGTKVAFVQTGWGRPGCSGGGGRSNLRSYVTVSDKHGNLVADKPLADARLAILSSLSRRSQVTSWADSRSRESSRESPVPPNNASLPLA